MINVDDSRESIAAQLKQTGTSIPVLVDEMQLVANRCGCSAPARCW